jgi:hypothetical protein
MIALRDRLLPLVTSAHRFQRVFANRLSMLNVSYRHSPIVRDEVRQHGKLRAGDRAPDGLVQLRPGDGSLRLFECLRGTRHVLLGFAGRHGTGTIQQSWRQLNELLSSDYRDLVDAYLILTRSDQQGAEQDASVLYDPEHLLHQRYGMAQGGLVLIRPDGYIGLRSQSLAAQPLQAYCQELFLPLQVHMGERQGAR